MIKVGLILGYGVSFEKNKSDGVVQNLETPYGTVNNILKNAYYHDKEVFIIKRHGEDEKTPSFMVNYKANIYALKQLGCEYIVSTSLCGSLQEEICPGEFIVFDQFIDLSTHRNLSFNDKFSHEELNLSAFNAPFSETVRNCLIQAAIVNGITIHTKSTVVSVDGPRQSTRAESNLFRSWGADVVNTTTIPEAILAHELNMSYGAISLCTYYDTWRTDIRPATQTEKEEIIDLKKDKFEAILDNCLLNLCAEQKIAE